MDTPPTTRVSYQILHLTRFLMSIETNTWALVVHTHLFMEIMLVCVSVHPTTMPFDTL